MSSSNTLIPLHAIKGFLWQEVKEFVKRETFPSVNRYIFRNGDNQLRVQVNLTKGDYFEPERIMCDIQITNHKCSVKGTTGTISALFSIPNVEMDDCSIDDRLVHVDFMSDEFWQDVELNDIEKHLAADWNSKDY